MGGEARGSGCYDLVLLEISGVAVETYGREGAGLG